MKKNTKWMIFTFILLLIVILIFIGRSVEQEDYRVRATVGVDTITPSTKPTVEEKTTNADVEMAPPPKLETKSETSTLTGQQNNAVRSAKNYINLTGFSREGLIQQLSSSYGDGYGLTDATVAVDSLNIDWNEQAVRSAKQYLDMTGFSCDGLIEQLSSDSGDKYTVSQATHGAQQAGACS